MARIVTFDCPSCGAPVKTTDDVAALHCEYCGNNLMVPDNLRSTPEPQFKQFGTTIVIDTGGRTYPAQQSIRLSPQDAKKLRRSAGCGGVILALFIIAVVVVPIGIGAWAVLSEINPGFVEEMTGSGFARKELSFGGQGRGPGLFDDVVDLTSDASGDIYVAERSTGRVQRFDKSGKYLNGWVVEGTNVSAIAANRTTGEILVVSDDKIHKYNGTTGSLAGTLDIDGLGFFSTDDLAIFPYGDMLVYVSGAGSGDLVRLDQQGQEVRRFPKAISTVYGKAGSDPAPWLVRLAVDGGEKMLVLDKTSKEVLIFGPDGSYSTRFGGEGEGFSFVNDIAVDGKGRIYVCHLRGVEVFDSTGRNLGQIATPLGTSASAVDVTGKDEVLVLYSNKEIVKYVPREP